MRITTRLRFSLVIPAIAVIGLADMADGPGHIGWPGSAAQAQGSGGGTSNAQGNQGGGQGQGREDPQQGKESPEAKGDGGGGGKPVWAQEGIPEVELGRLSVVRSPDEVLNRAFDEAINSLTPEMIDFYNIAYDEGWRELLNTLATEWDDLSLIDSPLQNLALMQDALDGTSALTTDEGVNTNVGQLLAIFLGVASDKTLPITTDTVIAVTTILGDPITGTRADRLAAAAEEVRLAVLEGHG